MRAPIYREIEPELRWLRAQLYDAIWNGDENLEEKTKKAIDRLEMLLEYGETHDASH